jgi:hypothetical protein
MRAHQFNIWFVNNTRDEWVQTFFRQKERFSAQEGALHPDGSPVSVCSRYLQWLRYEGKDLTLLEIWQNQGGDLFFFKAPSPFKRTGDGPCTKLTLVFDTNKGDVSTASALIGRMGSMMQSQSNECRNLTELTIIFPDEQSQTLFTNLVNDKRLPHLNTMLRSVCTLVFAKMWSDVRLITSVLAQNPNVRVHITELNLPSSFVHDHWLPKKHVEGSSRVTIHGSSFEEAGSQRLWGQGALGTVLNKNPTLEPKWPEPQRAFGQEPSPSLVYGTQDYPENEFYRKPKNIFAVPDEPERKPQPTQWGQAVAQTRGFTAGQEPSLVYGTQDYPKPKNIFAVPDEPKRKPEPTQWGQAVAQTRGFTGGQETSLVYGTQDYPENELWVRPKPKNIFAVPDEAEPKPQRAVPTPSAKPTFPNAFTREDKQGVQPVVKTPFQFSQSSTQPVAQTSSLSYFQGPAQGIALPSRTQDAKAKATAKAEKRRLDAWSQFRDEKDSEDSEDAEDSDNR